MLCCQTKDELAHAIMTAIRKHLGRQQHSPLEKAIMQLVSSETTPWSLDRKYQPLEGENGNTLTGAIRSWR